MKRKWIEWTVFAVIVTGTVAFMSHALLAWNGNGEQARRSRVAATSHATGALASDEDDTEAEEAKWATLDIEFSSRGDALANLYLGEKPDSWQPIRDALGQALHCPASEFANPAPEDAERPPGSMTRKARQDYRRWVLKYNQSMMRGSCAGVLAGDGWSEEGSFEIAPLLDALRPLGIKRLSVGLVYPEAPFHRVSQKGLTARETRRYAHYLFPVGASPGSVPLRVAFGFRPHDLKVAALIALGFVLVPILIIFRIRQVTLNTGGDDPFAAWFSYHRTVNSCIMGTILLWEFTDFHARQTLNDYLAYRWAGNEVLSPLVTTVLLFAPLLIVYAASVALSYQVYVRLRQTEWKRREYLQVQLLQGAAGYLPLMLVLAGSMLVTRHAQLGIICFLLAYVAYLVCTTLSMRLARTFPEALTTGELRDKIFELARRAGVAVRQVFVLPAGKGQIANAFAARNKTVMFTDYLLQKLSKREVIAVAAHELTHLRKRHPTLLLAAFLAALFASLWMPWVLGTLDRNVLMLAAMAAGPHNAVAMVAGWLRVGLEAMPSSLRDMLMLGLGFSGFYFLSRRFEFAADAGGLSLAGDPEAAITGLLKLGRLNLMPLQWGKADGMWLTHPTTLKRVERLAGLGGLAPGRLRQILDQYSSRAAQAPAEEHFPVPAISQDNVLSPYGELARQRFNFWVLVIFNWLPAVAVALAVQWLRLPGSLRIEAYVAGLAAMPGIYFLVTRWLKVRGRARLRKALLARARREGIAADGAEPLAVGLSPGPAPRFYIASYDWDTGLIFLARDRLYFLGRNLRCRLTREQVQELRLGPGAPGWIAAPRVYLRWREAQSGREGTLNLEPVEPCSARKVSDQGQDLFDRLSRWKQGMVQADPLPQLESEGPPILGEVTSLSPRQIASAGRNLKLLQVWIVPSAVAACILLRVEAIWYVCLATVLMRIFELLPYWRYRERSIIGAAPTHEPLTAAPYTPEN